MGAMSKCAGCALKIDGYRTEHGRVTNEVLHLCGKTLNLCPYRVNSCENYKERNSRHIGYK